MLDLLQQQLGELADLDLDNMMLDVRSPALAATRADVTAPA